MLASLSRQGLSLDQVPTEPFAVSDGLSLGLGHDVELLALDAEPRGSRREGELAAVAATATAAVGAVGLCWGSADMIIGPDGPMVLEVNSAPGLTTLAGLGHRERVVEVYRRLLAHHFAPPGAGR